MASMQESELVAIDELSSTASQVPPVRPGPGSSSLPGRCNLHVLCPRCQEIFNESHILKPTVSVKRFFTSQTEDYLLHLTYKDLRASLAAGCHFCTLASDALSKWEPRHGKTKFDATKSIYLVLFRDRRDVRDRHDVEIAARISSQRPITARWNAGYAPELRIRRVTSKS
jgi:hypothetical protein